MVLPGLVVHRIAFYKVKADNDENRLVTVSAPLVVKVRREALPAAAGFRNGGKRRLSAPAATASTSTATSTSGSRAGGAGQGARAT
jgi:hypothetical protein